MTHVEVFIAIVSIGRWYHLCYYLALLGLVVAHDLTDAGGPEVVSRCQCAGTIPPQVT